MKTVIQLWGMHLSWGQNKNLVLEGRFLLEENKQFLAGQWGSHPSLSHPPIRENPNTGACINYSQWLCLHV